MRKKIIRNKHIYNKQVMLLSGSQDTNAYTLLELALNKAEKCEIFDKYSEEFIVNRKLKLEKYKKQLHKLRKIPIIKQRTQEWYDARKTRLTASDLDEAIKDKNLRLAKKKAGIIKDTTNYALIPPLKWGTMFEAMATRCYSQARDNIEVFEFGLILHNTLEHFGASPDGINELGIMVEIKCPYSREIIDNVIPHKYYMQIQGQLAVCELEECDYIECDFMTYQTLYEYIDDIYNVYNNTKINHGIIAEYKNTVTEEFEYLYSNSYLTAAEAFEDIKEEVENTKNDNLIFLKYTPWRLRNINVQRVHFDKELWEKTVPKIDEFWKKVEECKLLPVEEIISKTKITFIADD